MRESARIASKRLFDVTVSAVLLLVCAPLFVIVACAIRLSGPGPVICRGLRVGRHGAPFRILRFRTTPPEPADRETSAARDSHSTRVGRVLRASRLDELPQLVNVLRGDMSLVGPRPESPRYLPYYSDEQRAVLAVRPGITGPSQIGFRAKGSLLTSGDPESTYIHVLLPAKLAMDMAYVRHNTMLGDLRLLGQTLAAVVLPARPQASSGTASTSRGTVPRQSKVARPALWRWIDAVIVRRVRSYGLQVFADVLIVSISFEVAAALRFMGPGHMIQQLRLLLVPAMCIGLFYAAISYAFGLHRRLWRYASPKDGIALLEAVVVAMSVVILLDVATGTKLIAQHAVTRWVQQALRSRGMSAPAFTSQRALPIGVVIGGALFTFLFLACTRYSRRVVPTIRPVPGSRAVESVLLVGGGQAGAAFIAQLATTPAQGYRIVACVDDDPAKWGHRIHGVPIVGTVSGIPYFVKRYDVDLIVIAVPSAPAERLAEIVSICQQTSARIKRMPSVRELVAPDRSPVHLRELDIADLLGRQVTPVRSERAHVVLANRTIMVTGAAGSIGGELCQQLLDYGPARVVAVDTNETGLFDLYERLRHRPDGAVLLPWIADITDERAVAELLSDVRPDILFHAAAYKHVPLLEHHPYQAARTNVIGTYRLCRLAEKYRVGRLVFISTDKAADPVNVYGASKRLGEVIVRAMSHRSSGATRFSIVRFGNVIGSRGSVVPIFTSQIQQGQPITVTDPEATRYFMTIPEACALVIATCALADQGSLFILDMGNPVRIADLAMKMIRLHGLRVGEDIPIVYTGLRPGERLHETLVAQDEALVPTEHKKISRVEHTTDAEVGLHATLDAWVSRLEHCLAWGDQREIADYLLTLASSASQAERELVPAGTMALRHERRPE